MWENLYLKLDIITFLLVVIVVLLIGTFIVQLSINSKTSTQRCKGESESTETKED